MRSSIVIKLTASVIAIGWCIGAGAQPPGFGPPQQPEEVPDPIVAPIPDVAPITGPGNVYDSSAALWPDRGIEYYDYVIDEYRISGTAAGQPYATRLVIRKPKDDSKFSGLIVAEAMHPAGAAHAFEYNSLYIMSEGHIAVEIDTQGIEQIAAYNPERYGFAKFANEQTSEILAQAGVLIKSARARSRISTSAR